MSLYTDLEDEVIADIARRVKKTGRYTETAELMAKSMREQGYSPSKIQAEVMKFLRADKEFQMFVAENTKAYKEEVRKIIKETVREAKKAGDELVAQAGEMSWNADLSMWAEHGVDLKKPNTMSQLRKAFAMQTVNELRNLTRTTGFKNVNTGTLNVLNAYQRELDLAVIKVATGTFSYDQAVQDCVHRLAQSGLRSIDYESGRTYQIDTAVRSAVRTGCSQLAGKITEENLKSSGQDLVITSQHMGSRPEHAPWQNRVFSYSGKSRKYPDFFKETGYGTVTGLKGANCMHDFYPFWEGASIIPEDVKEPDSVMIGGKEYTYYQATQKQRSMERDIRALKREINATEALGMDSAELRSKLKMKTAEYRKFSDSANLNPKNNRLRGAGNVVKYKSAKSSGAVAAPEIKDKKIRKAYDDFSTVLLNSKGNEKLTLNMMMYHESTLLIQDDTLKAPYAYKPNKDVISYNPKASGFELYDMNYVQSHELAHRMDFKEYHSWNNEKFRDAIAISKKKVYDNINIIDEIYSSENEFRDDVALSDIISALSDGELNDILTAGHDKEYWNSEKIKCTEIFANICSMDVNDYKSKLIIKDLFPELFSAYEGVL